MCPFPIFLKSATVAVGGLWLLPAPPAVAQDFSTMVGLRDAFGLDPIFSFGDGGLFPSVLGDMKGGFSAGLNSTTTYNSNLFHTEDDPRRSVSTSFGAGLTYSTDPEGGKPFSLSATYSPSYSQYWNNSQLSDFHHSFSFSALAQGSRTTISFVGGYAEVSNTDRLVGEFTQGALLNFALQASYQLAPRTSVSGGLSASTTTYQTSTSTGADIYRANVGAFWSATERFSFGPAFSYSTTKSDNTGTRESESASVQANYMVSEKVHIGGSLGLQWSQNSRASSNSSASLTGGFNASYFINELWSCGASVQYVNVPSPSQQNYIVNDLSMGATLTRQLKIGSISGGFNHSISSYESVGPVLADLSDENFSSVFLSYQRGFLNDRLGFNSSLNYAFNRGRTDWEQVLVSVGLSVQF